jgi:carbohydrate-selective porin OprB
MFPLTITEAPSSQEPVIISGCLLPRLIFDRIHAQAVATGKWQHIGVIYDQPADLRPQPSPSLEIAWSDPWWAKVNDRMAKRAEHFRTGQHLTYIVDQSYEQLHQRSDVAMILWISPDA